MYHRPKVRQSTRDCLLFVRARVGEALRKVGSAVTIKKGKWLSHFPHGIECAGANRRPAKDKLRFPRPLAKLAQAHQRNTDHEHGDRAGLRNSGSTERTTDASDLERIVGCHVRCAAHVIRTAEELQDGQWSYSNASRDSTRRNGSGKTAAPCRTSGQPADSGIARTTVKRNTYQCTPAAQISKHYGRRYSIDKNRAGTADGRRRQGAIKVRGAWPHTRQAVYQIGMLCELKERARQRRACHQRCVVIDLDALS